jgi:hypothetical protein
MLEELQKYDKLGTKDEILFILYSVLSIDKYNNIEDVKTLCIHHSYNFGSSFNGAIDLLELLNIIKRNDNQIKAEKCIQNYNSVTFFENVFIYEKLFKMLCGENKLDLFFNQKTIKRDNETQQYYIKGNQVPFFLNPIKKFLINTGFLELIENTNNSYFIKNTFRDFFTSYIINGLRKSSEKRKISLIKLKELQALKNKYGYEAEIFVLDFELNRLKKHPTKNNIKIISEEFSNAGYDIESFDSEESVVNDRFIEVKSYSESVAFYWSRNEVETAMELGSSYFLYLVDRKQININGYKPIQIQNPSKTILQNVDWSIKTDTYKIELKNKTSL